MAKKPKKENSHSDPSKKSKSKTLNRFNIKNEEKKKIKDKRNE